ncbi:MAG: tyrosine-type recombinase/integrase [Dehalococcoidia bacterium]|nr:tyrosine-type recombinase/integrase [Dehalococcoidia bacterium]
MRGHNEGTIYKRKDGRWEGAVTLDGGKRKRFYGKKREDVAKKLTNALKSKDEGKLMVPERLTVAQFLAQWLETTAPTVRLSTLTRYEEYARLHAVPELGTVKLARLTPQHLQKLYAQKLEAGLSPMTVRHLHAVMHRALSQALRWGLVATNVADAVDAPRVKRQEIKALSPEEARRLIDAGKGDRFEALYVLALSTGLRQGEMLGLRWKDVDLEGGCLQVVGTLQRSHHGLAITEPKTARSRRQVGLTDAARDALRQHRTGQLEERLQAGPLWEDSDLVFPNDTGRPMDAGNLLRRYFSPLLKKAGLSHIRFHDLRHSAATLLLSQGINAKVIQEMLVHSSNALTLDTYSHVLPTMQREAREDMEAILKG